MSGFLNGLSLGRSDPNLLPEHLQLANNAYMGLCIKRNREKLISQFSHLFQLGVVDLGDMVDSESQKLSE